MGMSSDAHIDSQYDEWIDSLSDDFLEDAPKVEYSDVVRFEDFENGYDPAFLAGVITQRTFMQMFEKLWDSIVIRMFKKVEDIV